MKKLTRALIAMLMAAFVAMSVLGSPAAQAAPGGPDQTPVMGWS
jgi:hypothetical protein